VLPKPPGPPAFWFQNEKPLTELVPGSEKVTVPVVVPLLTQELEGEVDA
jgi:hypothetical protein